MKFLLFDIDGTLIDSGGAGTRSLDLAFQEIFAVGNAFRSISMAGKTDIQILREGMELHGLDFSPDILPAFLSAYTRNLKVQIAKGGGHVKEGIRAALALLSGRDDFILGLLTGNIEDGARIKLDTFGLSNYFTVGAFGSDNEDRNRLLAVALDKLHRSHALSLSFADCVVIGDTPRDVACAKPYGASVIGVATGPYSSQVLTEAGADVVFEDLSDTGQFISALNRCGAGTAV
jgi:phosphoglycolate phosphatase-like HAD superfamily hydrolase